MIATNCFWSILAVEGLRTSVDLLTYYCTKLIPRQLTDNLNEPKNSRY